MSSDSRPLQVYDRVHINVRAGGRVGAIVEHSTVTDRFFVVYDIGGSDWHKRSDLTLVSEPLTPAPVVEAPRPRWEVETAGEGEVDTALADGWEPYAVTVEASERGYLARVYHLRRRVEVPDGE